MHNGRVFHEEEVFPLTTSSWHLAHFLAFSLMLDAKKEKKNTGDFGFSIVNVLFICEPAFT
jgi:hypothetical protein